jgi:hypothetical protein
MRIKVELSNDEVKSLILGELVRRIGDNFKSSDVKIQVRSKQNYRNQAWEVGEFKVSYEGDI